MVLVKGPRDTAWGPFKDALPRFDHAILYAVCLGVLWRLRYRPWLWWLVLLLAGVGVYVHPVSTPALGAMLLGAALAIAVSRKTLRRDLPAIAFAGVVFVSVLLPFGIPFVLTSVTQGDVGGIKPIEIAELSHIVEERFTGAYLSPSKTLLEYFTRPYICYGFVPLLIGGWVMTRRCRDREVEVFRNFAMGAVFGLATAAVLIPLLFELAAPPLRGAVFKGELPRAARYIIPWSYIIALMGARCLWRSLRLPRRKVFVAAILSIIGVVVVILTLPRLSRMVKAMQQVPSANSQVVELVSAIQRDVQREEPIVAAMADPLVIRYSALRSLAFATKDVPSMTSLTQAKMWKENTRTYNYIMGLESFDQRISATIDWAKFLGARVIVVERPSSDNKELLTTHFNNTQL
ncbi:MAG: hypothetical protein ACPL7O_08780, partial [Armatimonadota bacterium]